MNSKYKITKFSKGKIENIEDLISIEEPLEISLHGLSFCLHIYGHYLSLLCRGIRPLFITPLLAH